MRAMRRYEKTSEDLLAKTRRKIIDAIVGPEHIVQNPWEKDQTREKPKEDDVALIRERGGS